jgi:hypothetical protein
MAQSESLSALVCKDGGSENVVALDGRIAMHVTLSGLRCDQRCNERGSSAGTY